ncbi:hypothetical protein E3N88_25563 [Mikania micrantha]|uniref:Uncharacterized protein n=1 Tax=Mikania micrantha TaxID=192012 RepID=A0A5N6N531_9ASTR|nr:hypothetical protein E3N88_25563 [Mikania micrantha]
MGKAKVMGPENTPIEVWICLEDMGVDWLTKLFNNILKTGNLKVEVRVMPTCHEREEILENLFYFSKQSRDSYDNYSYENRYKEEEENTKVDEKENADATVGPAAESVSKTEAGEANQKTKSTNTKTADQDLDVFLLGDLGESDEGADDGNNDLDDDDFDRL